MPEGRARRSAAVALLVENEADIASVVAGGGAPAAAAPAPAAPAPAAAAVDVDMAEIMMPALSSTMTEGKISQWLKSVGDKIEVGDMVLVVESGKADMDVESFEEGYLAAILTPEGRAPVGAPVALLAANEADIDKVAAAGASGGGAAAPAAAAAAPAPAAAPAAPAAAAPASAAPAGGRVVASPFAKKLAEEKGISLEGIVGTGPEGRITAEDVEKAAAGGGAVKVAYKSEKQYATPGAIKLAKSKNIKIDTITGTGNFGRVTQDDVLIAAGEKPKAVTQAEKAARVQANVEPAVKPSAAPAAPAPVGVTPMNAMQKAVVKNMDWANSVPTYQVSRAITTDEFDSLYKEVKGKGVTVSALLAKAVGMVLAKHPIMNANYVPDGIQYNENVNVAMAVAMPDGGLITPVLQQADKKDIYSLGREWKEMVPRALEGKLKPDEFTTGTFTISNLGMFGVSSFVSILPPGQGAIMAVAASTPTAVLQKNGMIGMVKQMTVTLTCDHRHIYGADAAKFLVDLADLLENDAISLLK